MAAASRDEMIEQTHAEQRGWRALVDAVGRDRMNEPGPMGAWTFKDVAGHLAGWRNRRVAQLEAVGRREPPPPDPWPAELEDDDRINDWIRERDSTRSLDDVLADYDGSFDRLAAAISALPDDVLRNAGSLPGVDEPLLEVDWFSHLRDEHEPAIRAWLERSARPVS